MANLVWPIFIHRGGQSVDAVFLSFLVRACARVLGGLFRLGAIHAPGR